MCQSLPSCPRYFAHLPLATTAGEVVEDKIPWQTSWPGKRQQLQASAEKGTTTEPSTV